MKATGITRKIDDLGRITIPKEIRTAMGADIGTPMEFFVDGNQIILQKYERGCTFCGDASKVTYFQGKPVCPGCLKKLKGMK